MFVHSGASLHGHEYTKHRRSAPLPHHRPFFPSRLSSFSDSDSKSTGSTSKYETSHGQNQTTPSPRSTPLPPSLRRQSLHRRSQSDISHRKDVAVRFREPHMENLPSELPRGQSEDVESLAGSEVSDNSLASSARTKRSKREPRRSTHFALARPAPQLRTKQRKLVQIRPRLLLQLQQVGEKRAVPAYDVVPSSLVAGTLIIPHLAKRCPWIFRAKPYLGLDDLLIVRSEDYRHHGASKDKDGELAGRDVIGVVSSSVEGCVEIALEDGSIWQSSVMANGSYEFKRIDDDGFETVARWVRKRVQPSSSPSGISLSAVNGSAEYKWTFSFIDPSTKRHPIMGVLASNMLEIFDTYSTLSTSSGRYPPTRNFGPDVSNSSDRMSSAGQETYERRTVPVMEEHKRLMTATAIWVSLRLEGWPASSHPKPVRRGPQSRSISSETSDRSRTFPLSATTTSASTCSTPSPRTSNAIPNIASPRVSTDATRARAMSTGAAYMARRQTAAMGSVKHASGEKKTTGRPRSEARYDEEEETHTCRLGLRKLTMKLFSRKGSRAQQDKFLKHKTLE